MVKSSYTELLGGFSVPKTTIWKKIDLLFPPLKFTSLKPLWDLIAVGNVKRQIFREVIRLTTIKKSFRET